MTERGPNPDLARFGLKPYPLWGYPARTLANVIASDGTVLFGVLSSPGSRQTIEHCEAAGKPYIGNPSEGQLVAFLVTHQIRVLNVAGNRESKAPGIQEYVRHFLVRTLTV